MTSLSPLAPALKAFRSGTHRTTSPESTIERVSGLAPAMGITRVANVTGLDRIGIPVVMVCRPNSRSLAVSQGKGITLEAAKASGLMEAVELFHAERITLPLKLASYDELRFTHDLVDVAALPRVGTGVFHHDARSLWIEGEDLLSGDRLWVPFDMVHINCTLPLPPGSDCFPISSNGLASGNHPTEATSYAICELIERDATTLWELSSADLRESRRLDLGTVDDPDCRELLDRYERADVAVAVWDITSDVTVPAYRSAIVDRSPDPWNGVCASGGMGCHPKREIALTRALTEAAQSRLTSIAGSRDDMSRTAYEVSQSADVLDHIAFDIERGNEAPRRFQDSIGWDSDSFDEDVRRMLDALGQVGIEQVVAFDLSLPGLALSVARVVIPGLETSTHVPGFLPGPRARRVIEPA